MYVVYNNQLIRSEDLSSFLENRSFLYGDSLFETMIVRNGCINLFNDHFKRLKKGSKTLRFSFSFQKDLLQSQIHLLLQANAIDSPARVRLQVWRRSGGYYTPFTNEVDFIITVERFERKLSIVSKVNFCAHTFISPSPFSRFKTGNALSFILASIEKKEEGLDDVILLNHNKYIVEATSSNIFWEKDNIYYTPSLQTGCVAGVMRKNIIRLMKTEKLEIQKGKFPASELLSAHSAFLCNVTGIYPIQRIATSSFNIAPSYMNKLYTLCV